mgnify:CR=1 FL=1
MEYGEKIAKLRTQNNMSQEELANRLFVSRALVSKWENNDRRPNYENLKNLAALFSVKIEFFEPADKTVLTELLKCIPESAHFDRERLSDVLNEFLNILPERERNIFIRRYYFTETSDMIGKKYGINSVYVRVILSRTRAKLKSFLEKRSSL